MKKDILSINDINREDFILLAETALKIKSNISSYYDVLRCRTIVMIFDKPSLRTGCNESIRR